MHTYAHIQVHSHTQARRTCTAYTDITRKAGSKMATVVPPVPDVALSKDLRLIVAWWIQFTCLQSQPVKVHV